MVFLKEIFQKGDLEKKIQHEKLPFMQISNSTNCKVNLD